MNAIALSISSFILSTLVIGTTLDISEIDDPLYMSFLFFYSDVPTRMILPREGTSITSIVEGTEVLWKAEGREECILVTLHYRGGQSFIAAVLVNDSDNSYFYFCKLDGIWKRSLQNDETRIREFEKLKVAPSSRSIFSLDFSTTEETDDFLVIGFIISKMHIRMHIPELGHYAKEVRYGQEVIWKGAMDEICIAMISRIIDGEPCRVHLLTNDTIIEIKTRGYDTDKCGLNHPLFGSPSRPDSRGSVERELIDGFTD